MARGKYTVESPVLDSELGGYMLNLDRNPSSRFRVSFSVHRNGNVREIHSMYIHKRALEGMSLNDVLKQLWLNMWNSERYDQKNTLQCLR